MRHELLGKAETALVSARLLLSTNDTDGATNRAYYAMFDAATAALQWAGDSRDKPAKSHRGLIGRLGVHLVRAGHLSAELGRSFNQIHELRLTADYVPAPVPLDKAEWAIEAAERFVAAVADLLSQPTSRPHPDP